MILQRDSSVLIGNDAANERVQKPARLLLVDDEASILKSLKRLLRHEAFEIRTAECGADAIKLLEEEPADVVVSDFRMPGMVGTELLREVHQRWPDTVRIILSGYSEVTAILDAINEGRIYKYLTKPWNEEEIKLHLRRAVEAQHLERTNRQLNDRLRQQNMLLAQRYDDIQAGLGFTQSLVESMDAGVFCIDPDGLLVYANGLAFEWLLPSGGELIGVPAEKVLPSEFAPAIQKQSWAGDLTCGDKVLSWRSRCLGAGDQCRGLVVTLFEKVAA